MSSVTLTCNVAANDGSSFTVTSYQWNTYGCYTNHKFTGIYSNLQCFPRGRTMQNVTDYVTAHDAGAIVCVVRINNRDYTSEPFTLRISGEQLMYCVRACTVN